jgi:hypothetical protein
MHYTIQRRPWWSINTGTPRIPVPLSCLLNSSTTTTPPQTQALATITPTTAAAASDASPAAAEARLRGTGGDLAPSPDFYIFLADDFDAYPLGALLKNGPWSNLSNPLGSVVVALKEDDGRKAVKCTTAPGEHGKTAFLSLLPSSIATSSPALGPAFYGRFRFFLEAAPTEHDLHWSFIQVTGSVQEQPSGNPQKEAEDGTKAKEEEATSAAAAASYRAAYRFGGQVAIDAGSQLMTNLDTPDFYGPGKGPGTDCWVQGQGAVIPAGRWVCAEFALDGRAAHVGMRLWLDGEEVQALRVEPTDEWRGDACVHQNATTYAWPSPTTVFEGLNLGWESYNKDENERVLWVDDVALSRARIGC